MKKSSLIAILLIFILPVALFYFFKKPTETDFTAANAVGMPKVLQFSSAMCHDCKKIEKEMVVLRQEYQGKIAFQKINITNRTPAINQMIQKYGVNVVPTLIFINKNGQVVRKTEAYIPRNQLKVYLDELL